MLNQIESLELLLLFLSFFLSAFFSGSEAVLMSIGVDRAKQLASEIQKSKKVFVFMVKRPNDLLAVILIGNNVVNIWAASLTTTITIRLFKDDAIGISVGIVTIIILIFGEVIPKSFARKHAEDLAVPIIRILQGCYYLFYPIVKMLVFIIKILLGESAELAGRPVTKSDLEYMANKAEEEKTIDSKQLDLITSALEFPTIRVKDIMIKRNKVKYIKYKSNFQDISKKVVDDIHSRYPVCQDELDNIKGLLHVKDIAFLSSKEKEQFDINQYLKVPCFVYEHMKIQSVFDYMNKKKSHLALVKDENGLMVGIVTLEDIIEEILGDIQDEHDGEQEAAKESNKQDLIQKGIVVEGSISLRDLYNDYDIKIPLNNNYSTLAGFILNMLENRFPQEGQSLSWKDLSFELVTVDNEFRIKEILIKHAKHP